MRTTGLFVFIFFIGWTAGAVLAAGWLKLVAICVPFYAWYLVVELAMRAGGLVP